MKKLVLIIFVAFAVAAYGQKSTPEQIYDLGGKIDFFNLSESGVLVVAGAGGLAGIHPGAEKPHFIFKDYGKVKEEELEFVPASPYVIVNQGSLLTSKKTVIDLITGKVLFATEDNGWRNIAQAQVFLPQNKLVVIGNRSKKEDYMLAAGVYDLATGQQDGFASLDPKVGKVRMGNSVPQSSGQPFLSGDLVLVPTTKNMVCVNVKNGAILWTADLDKISWMSADKSGKDIYGFEERPNGDTRI